jgi:hypothetical protein
VELLEHRFGRATALRGVADQPPLQAQPLRRPEEDPQVEGHPHARIAEQEDPLDEDDWPGREHRPDADASVRREAVARRLDRGAGAERGQMSEEQRLVERVGDVVVEPLAHRRRHRRAIPVVRVVREQRDPLGTERGRQRETQRGLSAAAAPGDADEQRRHGVLARRAAKGRHAATAATPASAARAHSDS